MRESLQRINDCLEYYDKRHKLSGLIKGNLKKLIKKERAIEESTRIYSTVVMIRFRNVKKKKEEENAGQVLHLIVKSYEDLITAGQDRGIRARDKVKILESCICTYRRFPVRYSFVTRDGRRPVW